METVICFFSGVFDEYKIKNTAFIWNIFFCKCHYIYKITVSKYYLFKKNKHSEPKHLENLELNSDACEIH